MTKKVYIVHCVDTEGPMYEPIEDTFTRVKDIFNIDLEPTISNLTKLRNKKIDLDGLEGPISNLVSKDRLEMNETWDSLDEMLNHITSAKYRNSLVDSDGNGWIYSWFCLDHVGWSGYNPRRRDVGHHNIYDHYNRHLSIKKSNDIIQWHFHPMPANGNYNCSGTAYLNSNNIWEILSRKIIDRCWFPSVYRPGFHSERPDSHWFLEQWIPFDYGNQSMARGRDTDQPDLADGRYGDWRNAPKKWGAYHPSHENYQLKGSCKRWIFRCLNMEARLRKIEEEDVVDGFKRAQSGQDTVIAFTNHDFRNMRPEIDRIRAMIENVSIRFPEVNFYYKDALSAAKSLLSLNDNGPKIEINFKKTNKKAVLEVTSNGDLFGSQPYLAIKTRDDRYLWENFDFQGENKWSFTFDSQHIDIKIVEKIGVAGNSSGGNTNVLVYDIDTEETISWENNH